MTHVLRVRLAATDDCCDEPADVVRAAVLVNGVAGGELRDGEEREYALRRPAHEGVLLDEAAGHRFEAVVTGRRQADGDRLEGVFKLELLVGHSVTPPSP